MRVELSADDDHNLTLIAHDNGIGFPSEVNFRETDSLGLKLVGALTNQLAGSVGLETGGGATFKIACRDVRYKEYKERKYAHGTSTDHDC